MTNDFLVFLHVLYLLNAPAPDFSGGPIDISANSHPMFAPSLGMLGVTSGSLFLRARGLCLHCGQPQLLLQNRPNPPTMSIISRLRAVRHSAT